MTELEKIQLALNNFLERDRNALNEMQWGVLSESNRLYFVEGRLNDACAMILMMYHYILDRDKND